jgi:hypothetical protein
VETAVDQAIELAAKPGAMLAAAAVGSPLALIATAAAQREVEVRQRAAARAAEAARERAVAAYRAGLAPFTTDQQEELAGIERKLHEHYAVREERERKRERLFLTGGWMLLGACCSPAIFYKEGFSAEWIALAVAMAIVGAIAGWIMSTIDQITRSPEQLLSWIEKMPPSERLADGTLERFRELLVASGRIIPEGALAPS